MAISKRDRTIWQSQKLFIYWINFPVNSVADESPMTDETTTDTFRYFRHFQCLGNILRGRKLTPYSKTSHFSLKKNCVSSYLWGKSRLSLQPWVSWCARDSPRVKWGESRVHHAPKNGDWAGIGKKGTIRYSYLEYLGSSSGGWPLLFFLQRRKYIAVTSSYFHWK